MATKKKNAEALTANSWQLEEIIFSDSNYTDTLPAGVTLLFSDSSTISGNGGCNLYFGQYTTIGSDQIDLEVKGSTMRFCPEQEFESRYFDMLGLVTSYTVKEGVLQLNAAENGFTLLFKAGVPQPDDSAKDNQ